MATCVRWTVTKFSPPPSKDYILYVGVTATLVVETATEKSIYSETIPAKLSLCLTEHYASKDNGKVGV
jgi:hypothetical protein